MTAVPGARRLAALAALMVAVAAVAVDAAPAHAAPAQAGPTKAVVIAVLPSPLSETLEPTTEPGAEPRDRVLRQLERLGFAVGLASTAQGDYERAQAVLDLTQGTRQPAALYGSPAPAPLLTPGSRRIRRDPGVKSEMVVGWDEIVRRARRASVTIVPGLLAGSVPGGGAFVGVDDGVEAAAIAADMEGTVEEVSVGDAASLDERVDDARSRHRLVVVGLPSGPPGLAALATLLSGRAPSDLLVVVHLPPTPPERPVAGKAPTRFFSQTAIGIAGGGGAGDGGRLDSTTTRQPGLVSLIDIAPTALDHLGVTIPPRMRGQVVTTAGTTAENAEALESARRRWHDIRSGRQAGSLRGVLLGAGLFFLVAGAIRGIRGALPPALRLAGLGLLWWPAVALAAAPLAIRSGPLEAFAIAGAALAAAAITDRLVGWPRGPIVPAAVGIGLLTIDLALGGHLLTRSVLGPSIATGNRFYGVSNEIEPVLPILLLVGIAAVARGRHQLLYAAGGVFLAAVVGAGRLGADVGGVITISAAFAVAVLALRPTRPRATTLAAIAAVPVAALGALIAADLVLGGGGHLANNLTRSSGVQELWELVARRYELAFRVLLDPANAVGLAIACLVVVFGFRNRRVLLPAGFLPPGRAWRAVFLGGLAGGVAGALSNDSGPILLTNAVVALSAVGAYLRGRPGVAAGDAGQLIDETSSPTSTSSPAESVTRLSNDTFTSPRSMLLT